MTQRAAAERREPDAAAAPTPAAVAVPASRPAPAASVLGLQRTLGNHATSRVLTRQGAPPVNASSATGELDDAVKKREWQRAARVIAGMDPTARQTAIGTVATLTLARVSHAAEQLDLADLRNEIATELAKPARAGAAEALRDDDFKTALNASDWPGVVAALGGMTQPEIDAHLNAPAMTLERLNDISAAAASTPRIHEKTEAVRVRKLGEAWTAAYGAGQWERAITLVQAYNDLDLPKKLSEPSFDQIAELCLKADSMPSFQRVRQFAEPVRVKKLGEVYEQAINASNWTRALTLVNAYNDIDLLPKCRMIKTLGGTKLDDAYNAAKTQFADDNHRVRRTLSFLRVENLTGAGVRPTTPGGATGGTSEAGADVPGGKVTFSSGGQLPDPAGGPNIQNVYGLSYTGTDAPKTGWIQFIARNIEKFDEHDASLGFHAGTWTPQGQGARAFSTTSAPSWFLDTLSNQAPFYEATSSGAGGGQGASKISATTTAMFDKPSGALGIAGPLFNLPNVKKVKSRALFDTYLVRDMQVLRHETVTVEYTYTSATQTALEPVTTHSGGGAVNALPTDRYRAMTLRFPNFAYLPHN